MQRLLIALCFFFSLPWLASAQTYTLDGVKSKVVIDVRTPQEFATGHIEGAIHAPLHVLEDHAAYLDPALRTYVVCGGGYRSPMAAELLREVGVKDVVDVKGGMAEWKARGLPTTLS